MTAFSESCCVIRFEIYLHQRKLKIKMKKIKRSKKFYTLCSCMVS